MAEKSASDVFSAVLGVEEPWFVEGVSHTLGFERRALALMRGMPVSRAAEILRAGRWVLDGILEGHVRRELDAMDLSGVRRVMLDETSFRRGHRYITVIADADTRRIVFMAEGRGADSRP
ncbi:MAG: transposase [Candidatus Methanoplasma sp.]|jgi:transposase|nr:transposase [Candidatus Methanoplasma sp.]